MRFITLVIVGALVAFSQLGIAQTLPATIAVQQSVSDQTLTLVEAWRLAEEANPVFKSKQAQLAAAEGAQTDAHALLFNNPQISLERTRRNIPQTGLSIERQKEWSAGVSQTLEIAGQHGYRRDAANAALVALHAEIEGMRRQVHAEVAQQFYRVLALQKRAALENQTLLLFEDTARAIQKRRIAGEDTKLDANVAAVEAERARNQLALAQEQLLDARSELAAKLQWTAEHMPEASGDLAEHVTSTPYVLERLLTSLESHPNLAAVTAREDGARAKLNFEQANRYPDITVGLNVGREGPGNGRERLTTLSVSVPLPLFKRNATGIGQARTELQQAEIERQTTTRDARTQVRSLWGKLKSLQSRIRRLQDSVLPTLADNQQLSLKSQRAGQISLLELIVINRQTVEARRDLIDALIDYQNTRLALEQTAGWSHEGTNQ